jgi:hypothetical protein
MTTMSKKVFEGATSTKAGVPRRAEIYQVMSGRGKVRLLLVPRVLKLERIRVLV